MRLYLFVIGVGMLVISAVNIAFGTAPFYDVIGAVVFCTAMQFALDGLIAIAINKMPDGWFGVDNPLYRVSDRERRMYQWLNVKKWKDSVWELGGLGGFSKRRLTDPTNPAYIERFIVECNKGVLTHRLSYPVGFLVMLALPWPTSLTIALPVALVNLYLNILPTLVLRYNTPMLHILLKRLKRRI